MIPWLVIVAFALGGLIWKGWTGGMTGAAIGYGLSLLIGALGVAVRGGFVPRDAKRRAALMFLERYGQRAEAMFPDLDEPSRIREIEAAIERVFRRSMDEHRRDGHLRHAIEGAATHLGDEEASPERRDFWTKLFITIDLAMYPQVESSSALRQLDAVPAISASPLAFFQARAVWRSLAPEFLAAISSRLATVERADEFARLCEGTGILQNNILSFPLSVPEFALGMVAATLTSYANHMSGEESGLAEALHATELALLLKPRYWPAWSVMALTAYNSGDYSSAVVWADKVLAFLAFEPDAESDDAWEQSLAGRSPEVVKVREEQRSLMIQIKKGCAGGY